MNTNDAKELVRGGKLSDALAALQQQVRAAPADAKLRVFLFQLLAVMGQWERALTQLNVSAEMDASNLLMAQVGRAAIASEIFREKVLAGERQPLLFGEPQEWVGLLLQANQMSLEEKHGAAQELRDKAFDAAPSVAGTIDGAKFEWLADADPRLGPICEAIIDGRYFWVPFQNIKKITVEEPADLRDVIWTPATFFWTNGGNNIGLIPARYPGEQTLADPALALARKTEWLQQPGGLEVPIGQRMFATDAGEYPILQTRQIVFGEDVPMPSGGEVGNG